MSLASCRVDSETISSSSEPVVLRKHAKWNVLSWSLEEWKTFLQKDNESKNFKFRKGHQRCSKVPLWERCCDTVEMPISEFFDKYIINEKCENGEWLYFDYKHIAEWFSSKEDNFDISWKQYGFPDKTAKDSTIWIGTKNAHTPCHYDTYGSNFVVQLYGMKRWYLFPPSETTNIKPTRVPYEESSVYSEINFSCGCADISSLKEIRTVVLNPGDVLFVPPHWWHYVENMTSAISVNVWLPDDIDNTCRLEESLVKYFICSISRSIPDTANKHILNPNEDDVPSMPEDQNVRELSWCLSKCHEPRQMPRNNPKCNNKFIDVIVPTISQAEFLDLLKRKCKNCINPPAVVPTDETTHLRNTIINAFCHPDVISLVREKLQFSGDLPLIEVINNKTI